MEVTIEGRSSSRESTGMCLIASATTLTAISRTADLSPVLPVLPLGSVEAEEGAGVGAVTSTGESISAKKKERKRKNETRGITIENNEMIDIRSNNDKN
jgi:hypothetical protein